MPELPREYEKFDLSYLDNVVVFSEGWDFPMDGILELNTHLAVRPAEFELAQDGVEYSGHVVGLGKQSAAQLKVRAIMDFSISRYKTQVKVLGYDRQYIPMFSRRSCRCSGVKGSAQKECLELRFAFARCLEIVCGTIATPTSARIVERVTVGSTSACRTILRSSLLVVFPVSPDPVFRTWVPSRVHCSQQFLKAHYERSTWPATRHVDQPAVFIPMIRPLSNSRNCEKCLLARLPGMFRIPKSSYNRRVIVTFINLRICAGLYNTLFQIVAPPRRRPCDPGRGRPRLGWIYAVEEDFLKLRSLTASRSGWKRLVQKPMSHPGFRTKTNDEYVASKTCVIRVEKYVEKSLDPI
ncbi:uncharacterized protein TNCV_3957771 [Trichonephila clavipes]|nr:uncharacterized protein TNCV_3957771 [Trichonephila clavipes]